MSTTGAETIEQTTMKQRLNNVKREKEAQRGNKPPGSPPLRQYAETALKRYFNDLNGTRPGDLYNMVLREVEEPLFREALEYTRGNQSQAAEMLGINRTTLRKKLRLYGINP